ncbi:MAG: GNAT family N-acetyltransferase [Azospirillaceae bacterium]
MSDDFLIRRALVGDAPTLGRIQVTSWRESHSGILPADRLAKLDPAELGAQFSARLRNRDEPTATFVAVVAGRGAVGFGICGPARRGPRGHHGEIHALYVLGAVHGKGIGRALMTRMAGWLQSRALEPAFVGVLRDNSAARGFYEHLGGRHIGEKPVRWQNLDLVEALYGWENLDALLGLDMTDVIPLFPPKR